MPTAPVEQTRFVEDMNEAELATVVSYFQSTTEQCLEVFITIECALRLSVYEQKHYFF